MKRIGLTGGPGMGKSTAGDWFRHRGFLVVETDHIARDLVEPGQPALAEIRGAFGPEIIDGAGRLRRDALARIVFEDEPARRRLEAILHPRIRQNWIGQVEQARRQGIPGAVVDIPLLFETGAQSQFDLTICIACSEAVQQSRLMARGWSLEEIQRRRAAQWPIETKMNLAACVVWNNASIEVLAAQLERALSILTSSP